MTAHHTPARISTLATVAIVGALTVGTLAAACSSSGSAQPAGKAAGGAGAVPAANGATSSAGSVSGGGSSSSNAQATCAQVTAAQVQPLLTSTITKATVASVPDQVTIGAMAQQCTFAISGSAQALVITVVGGKDADNFYLAASQGITPAAVSGVGQKAVRDKSDGSATVTAEANGVACSADVGAPGNVPGVDALEKAAGDSANIGDANYAAVSGALGTLCNRVFGSGNTTPDLSGLIAAGAAAASATPTPSDGGLPTTFALPTDSST